MIKGHGEMEVPNDFCSPAELLRLRNCFAVCVLSVLPYHGMATFLQQSGLCGTAASPTVLPVVAACAMCGALYQPTPPFSLVGPGSIKRHQSVVILMAPAYAAIGIR